MEQKKLVEILPKNYKSTE
jgi:hypothetical protein